MQSSKQKIQFFAAIVITLENRENINHSSNIYFIYDYIDFCGPILMKM